VAEVHEEDRTVGEEEDVAGVEVTVDQSRPVEGGHGLPAAAKEFGGHAVLGKDLGQGAGVADLLRKGEDRQKGPPPDEGPGRQRRGEARLRCPPRRRPLGKEGAPPEVEVRQETAR